MKMNLSNNEIKKALQMYVNQQYGFRIDDVHFSNGERYIPVKFIDLTVKKEVNVNE